MTPLTLSNIADLHAEEFRADFPAWLQANHAIYAEFERQAELVASRRDHYSARTIAEVGVRGRSCDSPSGIRLVNRDT